MLFIADVVEPTDMTAIAGHDPIASGGREQATQLRLPPQAPLCILTADPLTHGERSVVRFAGQQRCPPTAAGLFQGACRASATTRQRERVVFRGVPKPIQDRMARCRLGERGGTRFAAVFEGPNLRDEPGDIGRAEAGFRVRSAWAALACGRVGDAANAARSRPSADVVCADRLPFVADAIKGLDSLTQLAGSSQDVITPTWSLAALASRIAGVRHTLVKG